MPSLLGRRCCCAGHGDSVHRDNDIARKTAIMFNSFAAFLLDMNMLPGKSEVLLRLTGPGVAAVKAQLKRDGMVIHFDSVAGPQTIHVLNKYTHLGMSTSTTCSHTSVIAHRKRT